MKLRFSSSWVLLVVMLLVSLACSSTTPTPKAPEGDQQPQATAVQTEQKEVQPDQPTPTTVPTATELPKNLIVKVGERAQSSGIGLVVVKVEKLKEVGFVTAEEGKVILDIEVVIENLNRDEKMPYNPMYFKVKDSESYEYDISFGSLDPSLQSGELTKGERVRGHVAFEVPEKATGLVVSYEPIVLFGGYEPVKVNLDEISDTPVELGDAKAVAPAGKVGDKVESAGIGFIVLSVKQTDAAGFATAKAGNTLFDIEVIIQNVSREETTPYNPFYFKIKDKDGFEYNTTINAFSPALQSGELEKGDVVRGHVTFEVKKEAVDLIVTYEPMVLFGDYKPIRISLAEKAEKPAEIPSPLPFPKNKVGTPVESAGVTLTVLSVQKVKTAGGLNAKVGYTYVDLEVEISNTGRDDPSPYNPLYFKVRDNQGYEYSTDFVSVEPALKSGKLAKGEKVKGHVAFEVPETAAGLLVLYEPGVLFGGYRIIRIDLGN